MSKTEDISKDAKEHQLEEELEIPTDINMATEIVLVSDKKKPEFFECSGNFTIFVDQILFLALLLHQAAVRL